MPITVTKAKPKLEAVVETEKVVFTKIEDMTDEMLADHYGTLQDQANAMLVNPVFNNLKLAEAELLKRVSDQVEPTDGAEIVGNQWHIEIAACSKNPRKIKDIPKVAAFLGQATFAKLAKVNISDIEKYLTPEQVSQVIDSETGYGKARKIIARFLGGQG